MNKYQEALEVLKNIQTMIYGNSDLIESAYKEECEAIEKELKALEIIKNKKVNVYHIWAFDDYQQYKEHYIFAEYHAIEDMLKLNEFNLLKEVLWK